MLAGVRTPVTRIFFPSRMPGMAVRFYLSRTCAAIIGMPDNRSQRATQPLSRNEKAGARLRPRHLAAFLACLLTFAVSPQDDAEDQRDSARPCRNRRYCGTDIFKALSFRALASTSWRIDSKDSTETEEEEPGRGTLNPTLRKIGGL